jgi:hypothetical protein
LLIGIQGLCEKVVPCENHDDRQVLIDKSENTVLQLAGHDSLAVEIGNLLDFERTYM